MTLKQPMGMVLLAVCQQIQEMYLILGDQEWMVRYEHHLLMALNNPMNMLEIIWNAFFQQV